MRKVLKRKVLKVLNIKNSGPDSPPQVLGMKNIAQNRVVRLGYV